MKNLVPLHILALLLLLFVTNKAQAQVPVMASTQQPLVNEYLVDGESPRKASWWNLLGRQLTNTIDKPREEVSVSELQNIIFFATHHKEKVKLHDAMPSLLDIAKNHENDGYRIMAISAIHAIGHAEGMKQVRLLGHTESSERVGKVIKAAVADYYDK